MAPIEEPWTATLAELGDVYRASLSSAHSSGGSNSSSSGSSTVGSRRTSSASSSSSSSGANNSGEGGDWQADKSPPRQRWRGVKTWMFGQMLGSSFAKVSLERSAPSSRSSSRRRSSSSRNSADDSSKSNSKDRSKSKPAGTNDWDACFVDPGACPATTGAGSNDWDACYRSKPSSLAPSVSASSSSSTLCADAEAERARARRVFDTVRVIGSGSYGTVVLSRLRGGAPDALFAIKVVDKRKLAARHGRSARELQRLRTEQQVLASLDHPFITKLVCSFETPASLNFVLEYCAGGDLYFLLEKCAQHRLPEAHVAFYAASVALALGYLHERGVVYRDLKPENLLLDRHGFLRLADFGFARAHVARGEQSCSTFCGSADYIAPEVVRGAGYGMAADLWSFGCVVFELLTGFPPFYCRGDRSVLFRKIECSAPLFPPHVSPAARDLLEGLLHKDAAQRLGAGGMADVFAHPFFAGVDWYLLSTKQLVPPLVPSVDGPLDTSNFEEQFTSQRVDGSLVFDAPRAAGDAGDSPYFDDFDWCRADIDAYE